MMHGGVVTDMKGTIKVKPHENAVYIVKDGRVTKVDPPESGHGTDEIKWKDGQVLDVIRSGRIRIDGQANI